jgi:hypothetical protein
MLDIETLGEGSSSVIISIGAVLFDPYEGPSPDPDARFRINIDVQSSLNYGLKVTGATLKWWVDKKWATLSEMLNNTVNLPSALNRFREWLEKHGGKKLYMWGRSPRFDEGRLQDAYYAIGQTEPWDFRKEMCVRTIMELVPGIWETTPQATEVHNPESDALKQIEAVRRAYYVLGLRQPLK